MYRHEFLLFSAVMFMITSCSNASTLPEDGLLVDLEKVASDLSNPTDMAFINDGSGRFLVTQQNGQIVLVSADGSKTDFLDISGEMVELTKPYDERGLLGIALHPDFVENGRFFIYYSASLEESSGEEVNHIGRLSEFTASGELLEQVDSDSEKVIFEIEEPFMNHNGGGLRFGPDGYLYLSLGDGGDAGDPFDNGQNVNTLLGTIIRIDIDNTDDEPYAIPADNPFVGIDGADEIYAFGLRNPYRFSFDRDGDYGLILGDVGQNMYEEVNLIEAGGNYGWHIREATHCYSPAEDCPDTGSNGENLIEPIIEYSHEIGSTVIGGYIYRGTAIPELAGLYVFGDWSQSFIQAKGQVFVATPDEEVWKFESLYFSSFDDGSLTGHFVTGFGEDPDGELYVITDTSPGTGDVKGIIYKIIPSGLGE